VEEMNSGEIPFNGRASRFSKQFEHRLYEEDKLKRTLSFCPEKFS
jgi:hypothetical protein